jgi:DNA end-binding protein Ku
MAARALSTATISFGLVSIPVKLYTTGESRAAVSFNMLHACGTRVKQQYWCPKDERVVPREEIVKGYEFAKGQYVTFTEEELKALEAEASHMIEIREFIPEALVDPVYFERAYYLGPDKGGDKPYKLLAEAMRESERVALASYAARGKSYLVLLRPFEDGLVMQQLRYPDEVRSFSEVERGGAKPNEKELSLARKLIDQISSDAFHPEAYEDEVKKRVEEVIARKVEGEEVTYAEAPEPQAKVIDLMEALKASLESKGASERVGPKRAASKKARKQKASS